MDNNKIKLYKFSSGLSRTSNYFDMGAATLLDNTNCDLYIAEDKSFIIYEKTKLPLTFIRVVYIGDPDAESTKAPMRLAQRDVSMRVIYRVKERDLTMIYYHDGSGYKFSHITFSNRDYR